MKKTLLLILVLFSLLVLIVRFSGKAAEVILNIKPKSGISVMSEPRDAKVFLNNQEVGKTPYEDQSLEPKEYLVKIEKDGMVWQGKVKLKTQTLTVVNRELSSDQGFGAGEILTLDKGKGLTVVSNPSGAEIEVDGKPYGTTPLSVDIPPGEHSISFHHPNYLKRDIKALIPSNFNLTVSVDLLLSEADLTTIPTPPIKETPQLLVLETPTGFLRVRDKPSTLSKEVTRVKPGDTLILLEELPSWYRVRLPDDTEGYVSSAYVSKPQGSR